MINLSVAKGSTSLSLQSPTCLVDGDAVKWGSFEHTERFKRWLALGKKPEHYPYGEWYDPAVHTLPVVLKGGVDALDDVMVPGAYLVASDGTTTRTAYIMSVERDEPIYYPGHAEVTYAVTTRLWDASVERTHSETITGSCFGVATPPTVGGDAPALTEHRLACVDASSCFVLAVVPAPPSAFSPVFDLGTVDSTAAIGGRVLSEGAVQNVWTECAAASFDPSAFGGDCLAIARVGATADVNVRAVSVVSGSGLLAGSATTVDSSPLHYDTPASGYLLQVMTFGPLPVPCADSLFAGGTASAWTDAVQTNVSGAGPSVVEIRPESGGVGIGSITTTGDRFRVAIEVQAGLSNWLGIYLMQGSTILYTEQLMAPAGAFGYASTGWVDLPAGTYAVAVSTLDTEGTFSVKTNGAGVGNREVFEQSFRTIASGIVLEALSTSAGTSVYTDAIMVVPVKGGAVLVAAGTAANGGVLVDATSPDTQSGSRVYEYANNGTADGVGQAIASAEWIGPDPRYCPGDNAICVAAGAPNLASAGPSGLRYSSRWTERFLRPVPGA